MVDRSGVRIVTINTWKGDGPYRTRLDALAEGLTNEGPDIVALQESLMAVDGSLNTAEFLSAKLGMHCIATRTRRRVREAEGRHIDSWSGPAIISRWPITSSRQVGLPSHPADGERVALVCTIKSPYGYVEVINLHLTHLRDFDQLRCEQLQRALCSIDRRQPIATRILCGDFNSTPDSDAICWLNTNPEGWRVTDAMADADEARISTLSSRNPYVSHPDIEARIDYIFSLKVTEELKSESFHDAEVVLDRPASNGVQPSDHFGIAATLTLH